MEWHPRGNLGRRGGESLRAELDDRVRSIDWTEEACAYDSPQRRLVAEWMAESGLVEQEMRRRYPGQPEAVNMMSEYVKDKVWEKTTGVPITSKSSQWNWSNLWDPRLDTSYCAWVRRLSISIARLNQNRVLKSREQQPDEPDEDEDSGRVSEYERRLSVDVRGGMGEDPFRENPRLRVPRPIGADRDMLLAMVERRLSAGLVTWRMRRMGWWDPSLDAVDEGTAASLLLQPLTPAQGRLMERMPETEGLTDTPDTRQLVSAYWRTQTKRLNVDGARLKRMISARAEHDDVLEWTVIVRLGTLAARTLW